MDELEHFNNELKIVYRYLRKKGISHEDAQDIVQETAYKYLLFYETIKTPQVRSWLIRVALNFYYDQYRKNKRIKIDIEEKQISILSKDLPENILQSKENWSEIEVVLGKLKPKYKELILLKYIGELKYEEISKLLDMKLSTIKTSLYRARKQFTKIYGRIHNER